MTRVNKMVTVGFIIAPLLSLYATNILSFSFFDIFLLLLTIIVLFHTHSIKINRPLFRYGIMIVVFHILTLLAGNTEIASTTLRMLRYLFYILFLAFFSTSNFEAEYGERVYRFISMASAVFLFAQQIVYSLTGHYIPGFLTFLPLLREELMWHAMNYQNRFLLDPRPRSFFSEPQIFASFVLGYLAILLFKNYWDKKDKIVLIILSLAVLLSRSTTAIICLVFLWGMFVVHRFHNNKINPSILILLVLAFVALVFIAPDLYSSRLSLTSHSFTGRMDSYSNFFNEDSSLFKILFGNGMIDIDNSSLSNYTAFIPSLLRFYKYYGVLGCFIVVTVFLGFLRRVMPQYKHLLYLEMLLLVGTVDFYGVMIFTSLPFVIANENNDNLNVGVK